MSKSRKAANELRYAGMGMIVVGTLFVAASLSVNGHGVAAVIVGLAGIVAIIGAVLPQRLLPKGKQSAQQDNNTGW